MAQWRESIAPPNPAVNTDRAEAMARGIPGLDGTIEGEGAFFVARLPPGEASIRVTALDPSNNSCSLIVNVTVAPSAEDDALIYAASVPALVVIAIWAVRKRVKRH